MWQLARRPLTDAEEIPGTNPKVFVLQTTAWIAEGIPPLSIGYSESDQGIEIVSLALHKKPAK